MGTFHFVPHSAANSTGEGERKFEPILNKQVLEDSFKTDLLYKNRNQELDSRFQRVLDLMQAIEILAVKNPELVAFNEILLVNRFLNEQAIYEEQQKKWQSKANKDIDSSSLQLAYDRDVTYRNKAGKHHSAYVLNLSETCSKENPVQFITDFTLQPNNKSDVNIARERTSKIKGNTDVSDLYVDGGYYSKDLIEDANKLGISLHYTDMTGRKAPSNKMSISSFHFNEQMEVLSCPQGKVPLRSTYNAKNKTRSSHFSHDDCKDWPYFDICPVKSQKKNRVLRVNGKTIVADQTRQQIMNKEIKRENTSYRAAIEGTNSALKRGEDMEKLNVRGILKSHIVSGYKVIARNTKQFSRFAMGKIKNPKPKLEPGIVCSNPS